MNNRNSENILLNAVTADGTGSEVDVGLFEKITLLVKATGVTTGATFKLQTKDPAGNWYDLWTNSFTATGTQIQIIDTPLIALRGDISSYTDGTYTASIISRR